MREGVNPRAILGPVASEPQPPTVGQPAPLFSLTYADLMDWAFGEDIRAGHIRSAFDIRDVWTYTPVQQIVERSGTPFFSFQDLDSTKPAGSVKIRVETITHYLEHYAGGIIEKKKAAMGPGCPLLPEAAVAPTA